jgi:hypothetical protein
LTTKAPYKGLGADSEAKREPVSGIDTAAADSLKVLDPKRLIREADIDQPSLTDLNFMSTRPKSKSTRMPSNQYRQSRRMIQCSGNVL